MSGSVVVPWTLKGYLRDGQGLNGACESGLWFNAFEVLTEYHCGASVGS